MKVCGNKLGTDKTKRKRLSIDIQLLSRFTCTQTRGRTGMEVNPLVFEKKKEKKIIKHISNTSIFRE